MPHETLQEPRMITWPDVWRAVPFARRTKPAAAPDPRGDGAVRVELPDSIPAEFVALWHDRLMIAAPAGTAMHLDGEPMRPADGLIDVNILANPAFAQPAIMWRSHDHGTRTGRDLSPAHQISGGHTGYFRVDCSRRADRAPVYARYVDPTYGHAVPISGGGRLRWSALLAAQGATAGLIVEVLDAAGGVLARSSATAPGWASGGRNPQAYARVADTLALPMDAAAAQFTLELAPLADAEIALAMLTDLALGVAGTPLRPMAELGTPLAPLRHALAAGERVLFCASLGEVPEGAAPQPMVLSHGGVEHTIAVRRDESDAARLFYNDGEITVEPGRATGRLAVVADGAWVGDLYGAPSMSSLSYTLSLPRRLIDGRRHTVELVSAAGCHARTVIAPRPFTTPWEAVTRDVPAPVPGDAAPHAPYRYRALAQWTKRGERSAWLDAHLGALHDALVSGEAHARPFAVEFPQVADPEVSIVLCASTDERRTFITRASLAFAPVDAPFEVISAEPSDGVSAVNAAAEAARGRVIVVLDAGVEVTAGWLDSLLRALARADVGVAGPKVLDPDGRLAAAGGHIGHNMEMMRAGEGDNPFDPRYNYARQVDFVPPGALAVAAVLWRELGGLSDAFASRDVACIDLAFRAAATGCTARYAPNAVIIAPQRRMADAPDLAALKRAWAHRRPATASPLSLDRDETARVLFALADLPRPDVDAGSVAALEEIQMIQALGAKVTLVTQGMAHLPRYSEMLAERGVEFHYSPFYRSMGAVVAERGGEFDAVYVTKYQVLEELLPGLRRHAPQAKILLNLADLQFLRVMRSAVASGDAAIRSDADVLRTRELAAIEAADAVCTYSNVEASVIESHCGTGTPICILPWVEREVEDPAPLEGRAGMAFLGNYRHPPNAEAVRWFANEVMPHVLRAIPDARFHIYGAYADELPGIAPAMIEGHAPDLKAMFDRHRISVVPLRTGAGVKGKVFAALGAGVPMVATPTAVEGIAITAGEHALVAADAEGFAQAVVRLSTDDDLWHRIAESGRTLVRTGYGFEAGARAMQQAFEAAGLFLPLKLPHR